MKLMGNLQSHIHDCSQMPVQGVAIRFGIDWFAGEGYSWCLFAERLATEEDLKENNYLEEVGETIWTTVVEIKFCPYCGKDLFGPDSPSFPDDYGRFFHMDSSGWLSRRS